MHFKKFIKNNYLIIFILIGIILHLISIYFTIGFYSDDEHFQILEIAAYKLGINKIAINDPTGYYWEWENHIRMRPWIQPFLYFKLISIFKIYSNDPFVWTLILRFLSSIIGFISIVCLFFTFKNIFFKNNKIFNYFLFFSFWFYPFLHSRTSSENISLSIYIISLCILYKFITEKKILFNIYYFSFASFLLGISMVFKFTTVFSALPIFFWFLIFSFNFKKLLIFCTLILVALSIGLFIDYINWGSFKNTYYQFYFHNLSSGVYGRMKDFGVDPWYFYFIEILKQLAPPSSIFYLSGLVIYWFKNPKSLLTFITVFTFSVFCLIGHKELRYIFSIYIFAPFFIAYLIDFFKNKKIIISIKSITIISNLLFLLITLFFPANSKVGIYKYLFENYNDKTPLYFIGENPYQVNNMEPFFYTNYLPPIKEFKGKKIKSTKFIIVSNDFEKFNSYKNLKCINIYSTYPSSIINLNNNWKRLKINWNIYNCSYF